jgi:hypothetical protein
LPQRWNALASRGFEIGRDRQLTEEGILEVQYRKDHALYPVAQKEHSYKMTYIRPYCEKHTR